MNSGLITNIILGLVAAIIGINSIRSGFSSTAKETVLILKEALAAKDIQIAEMRASHDSQIASLKSDIIALTAQMDHLKEANLVLQNTVTGKDTLISIVDIMKPIPALFAPGGFIDQVKINQQKTLKDLAEIRQALELSPVIPGPPNRPFKKRVAS